MKTILTPLLAVLILYAALSCRRNDDGLNTDPAKSSSAAPDYTTVFPQDRVNSLDIIIGKTQWNAVLTDGKDKLGTEFGKGGGLSAGGLDPNNPPVGGQNPPVGGQAPQFSTAETNYVPVTVAFNGKTWQNVGFRIKGNSSLISVWGAGIYKLPFRLKMDKFEDQYPETKNQRIYGFKDLSMSPAYSDNSLIRDKVTADLFRQGGVATAQTAFYRVTIDFGEGPKYCGVYCLIEVVDDTMLKAQLGEEEGNVYKPESALATFTQTEFPKKNNENAGDYSDVQTFVTALNSPLRKTTPDQWRLGLEKTFNVDNYLRYLAINNAIVNWDSYGAMAHNYYLYNHSAKKLTWIPWDFNMAMSNQTGGGNVQVPVNGQMPPNGQMPGGSRAVSLSMTEVGSNWPLLVGVREDPVYFARYKQYVKEFADKVFTTDNLNAMFERYTNLITPYVTGTQREVVPYSNLSATVDFSKGLSDLKQHATTRTQAVKDFLK